MPPLSPASAPAVPLVVVAYDLRDGSNGNASLTPPNIVELPPSALISHLQQAVFAANAMKLRGCDPTDLDIYPPGSTDWTDRSAAAKARSTVASLLPQAAGADDTFVVIARPLPSFGGARADVWLALAAETQQELKRQRAQLAKLAQELQAMSSTARIWSAGASHHSSQSSSRNQRTFKDELIAFWECAEQQQEQQQDSGRAQTSIWRSTPSPTSQRSRSSHSSSTLIKCQLTQEYYSSSEVTAAHLFPKRHADIFYTTLGLSADKIYSVRNGLLLCQSIENAFDRQRVCFIYNALDRKFYFRVLDAGLRRLRAEPSSLTFGELDGRPLCLPEGKMPYRRVLALHAREALAHAKTEYEFETSEEDAKAIEEALNLSDRVSRDADERDRNEESLNESAVIGTGNDDSYDIGVDLSS